MLEKIRIGNITEDIISRIQQKIHRYNFTDKVLDTTHIVGYRNTASTINDIIGNYQPSVDEHTDPYESIAIDYMGNVQILSTETDKLFRHYTNLPTKIILKEGMRVMFLNNSLFTKGLFNGSIGVVLKIIDNDTIQVTFPLKTGIANVIVVKETSYFRVNGIPSHCHQFPLQNAFALTVHKTQGLTLPHVTVSLDESICKWTSICSLEQSYIMGQLRNHII
ncbi:hypothetical protein Glove_91g64 [Diversispora epigaea]|uniref:ATP-dependent DNA helicase n=1 Tax=Diversispora epigaea TaxID=1348612 RepID=A0A397JEY1_9GLOM|nr:hypothetical protein Glove_91g64 [Diversispora epigaea]